MAEPRYYATWTNSMLLLSFTENEMQRFHHIQIIENLIVFHFWDSTFGSKMCNTPTKFNIFYWTQSWVCMVALFWLSPWNAVLRSLGFFKNYSPNAPNTFYLRPSPMQIYASNTLLHISLIFISHIANKILVFFWLSIHIIIFSFPFFCDFRLLIEIFLIRPCNRLPYF